jgi:hypothetical protein
MSQTRDGGKPEVKPLPYSPPVGPVVPMSEKPGLGGTNHGQCGTQGKH